jgi:short-subunit dehydrogenase
MLALNITTVTELTHLFGKDMVSRGQGHILQVGSVGSFQPGPLYGAYAATKAYVLSLGEALACELRGTGVTSTVVCPGVTETEFLDSAGQDGKISFYQKMVLMQADVVVRQGLDAMLAGRPSVVTGWLNKLQIFALRLVSRRFAARAALWGMRLD